MEIKKIQTEKRITMREARQIRRESVPLVPRKYTNEKYSTIVTGNTNVTQKINLEMTSEEDENNKNSNVDTQETNINNEIEQKETEQLQTIENQNNNTNLSENEIYFSDTIKYNSSESTKSRNW